MSLIPIDLYKRGKQTFAIERNANVYDTGSWADVIASTTGTVAASNEGYSFTGVSSASPSSGFTTRNFIMRSQDDGDVIIAAELWLYAYQPRLASLDSVILSDGTNSVTFSATDGGYAGNTNYTAVIGGVTTTGVIANSFNFGASYASSRNLTTVYPKFNLCFRADKNRREISLWVNDQLKGAVSVTGLENFTTCAWTYTHTPVYSYTHYARIKQIGIRLEC